MPKDHSSFVGSAWRASGLYLLVTLATTWPLATRLTRSLPIDLGDSLLNCWILNWSASHIISWASGHFAAFQNYWHPPIYHPAPYALAYSEHLFAQSLEIAPLFALTGNIVLCYNVLTLSTFVLSALGTYLLVRELTDSPDAAFVAGLCYGFALMRLPQLTHLQVVSSEWLPFVLYGLRRFFTTLEPRPLAGATAALIAQNLSCGYYLVFFSPFVALYCVYEIADRRLWRHVRMWLALAASAALVGAVTWPFLKPYLALRALGFPPRSFEEVAHYSADVLAFVTTSDANRVWGRLQPFLRSEGELFPGLVPLMLASVGLAAAWRDLAVATAPLRETRLPRRVLTALVLAAAAVYFGVAILIGATGDATWHLGGLRLRLHDQWRAWLPAAVSIAAAFALSPRLRAFVRGVPGSAMGFFAAVAAAAAVLALGVVVTIHGRATLLPAPYAQLYWHVPGFDGLRVPARYGMLVMLALAVLAGYGARAVLRRGRTGRITLAAMAALFLVESTGVPIDLDKPLGRHAPQSIRLEADMPDVYRAAAALPPGAVLIEFPFGIGSWDLQYVFYQQFHHRPIVNGYSGGSPAWYGLTTTAFSQLNVDPAFAWRRLAWTGASYAIVHREAYRQGGADILERWLVMHGSVLVRASGDDRLYALPQR